MKDKYSKWMIKACVLILFTLSFLLMIKKIDKPDDKYRAEHTSSTAHTILIDDHYWVSTSSAKESKLLYSKAPIGDSPSVYDQVYSYSVDKLNFTDKYILVGAQSDSTGDYSYMILDIETGKTTGYANIEEFEIGKKEEGLDIELLDKKCFDWY